MARASGGANNMRPLSWGGGAQTEKILRQILHNYKEIQLETRAHFKMPKVRSGSARSQNARSCYSQ